MGLTDSGDRMARVLVVVNSASFLASHRLPLLRAAMARGHQVEVAAPISPMFDQFEREGFRCHAWTMSRSGQNLFRECLAIFGLLVILRRVRPDIVHLVTVKPILYGGMVARLLRVGGVICAVSGLGTVFVARGRGARIRRGVVRALYRVALRHPNLAVIVQNPDDRRALTEMVTVPPERIYSIRGSGVDLASYRFSPEPDGKPVVLMAARLLKDKGVCEFARAAELLSDRGVDVTMRLIGDLDPSNPSSVDPDDLERWKALGRMEVLGFRDDIADQYANSHIACLPSYREGLPKSLIEAAASGRAIVTTDVPGCRDAIVPGETGLLVPVGDPEALADAVESLVVDERRRSLMGLAGRALAEKEFAIERVTKEHMRIYQEVLSCV